MAQVLARKLRSFAGGGLDLGARVLGGSCAGSCFSGELDPVRRCRGCGRDQVRALSGKRRNPINREIFAPGVCVADFDGDGYQDIYFVNGRDLYGRGVSARNALYRNNGDGTFTDITDKAGVTGTGYGLGCVWGDYDNDGFPDLFVTQYGRNVLYHNNGDGTFSDVTDKAKVGGTESGTLFH